MREYENARKQSLAIYILFLLNYMFVKAQSSVIFTSYFVMPSDAEFARLQADFSRLQLQAPRSTSITCYNEI
jgi:hypothetical protein